MSMEININLNVRSSRVEQFMETIMATLQETLDLVRAQKTQLDSLNMFVEGLYHQIKNLPLSAENQAMVDEIFAELKKNDTTIADAFTENTPAA